MNGFLEWYCKQDRLLSEELPRVPSGGALPWWSKIPGAKGAASAMGQLTGKGAIDWDAAERQAAERRAGAPETPSGPPEADSPDNPEAQKKKINDAQAIFSQALSRITDDKAVHNAAKEPMQAIAHAFISGGVLVPNYAIEIMRAAHASSDVDNKTLLAYFDDPSSVILLFQQALAANQNLWYDVASNQKYAPQFGDMNQRFNDEFTAAREQWQKSPFRRSGIDASEEEEAIPSKWDPTEETIRYLKDKELVGKWTLDEIKLKWVQSRNAVDTALKELGYDIKLPSEVSDEDVEKLEKYAKR